MADKETANKEDMPNGDEATNTESNEDIAEPKKQAVLAPLPLEWTQLACPDAANPSPADTIRYPWDVMDLPASCTEMDSLEIVGTSGQKVTRMGGDISTRYPNLESLVLRSHLIRTMDGLAKFTKLEVLELYDNMIDELRDLNNESGDGTDGVPGRLLRVLDMSYNVVRDMGPVEFCPNLQELYIAQNKIKSIKGLRHLKHLRKIDLGANRIRVMEGLDGLVSLEELWLGKNKIEKIEGLDKLTKLRRLDVQSNRLTKIENLAAQVNTLEELYLAHNGIDIEGAKCETGLALHFTALDTLDLSRNRLVDTTPFAHLTTLTELWISGNEIKTFNDIQSLSNLTNLKGVYLEYNPVANEFEYRKKLAEIIPSLDQIDANMIAGLGAHGYMSTSGVGLEERMRQLQDSVMQKAAQETK